MDTAHTQAAKRLERGQAAILDLQSSVRDGLIALKGLLDELRRNMETEKHTINTFCQGMQEAMAKTHAAMIMEVQRQHRPLQSAAIRTNYRNEFAQNLEPWVGRTNLGQHGSDPAGKLPRSRSRILGQLIDKVRPSTAESRERTKSVSQPDTSTTAVPKQPPQPPPAPAKCKKPLQQSASYAVQHQQHIDRLENHLKEKIHDIMMCRRQSKLEHSAQESSISDDRKLSKSDLDQITKLGAKNTLRHKKMGKSCDKINTCSKLSELSNAEQKKKCGSESDYQRISEATSQSVKALVHKESRSSPSSPKCKNKRKPKVYPFSDGEDNVFYSRHDSADSLSTVSVNSRRSSLECPDKTLVVVIGARKKPLTMAQKQRSWETFPPKRRHHICKAATLPAATPLRKTDSFEGHEEAVKTLVAAVQETRRKPKTSN
ncbi:hypothetical protein CBL_12900 [Carabus blaptoides fortunei]